MDDDKGVMRESAPPSIGQRDAPLAYGLSSSQVIQSNASFERQSQPSFQQVSSSPVLTGGQFVTGLSESSFQHAPGVYSYINQPNRGINSYQNNQIPLIGSIVQMGQPSSLTSFSLGSHHQYQPLDQQYQALSQQQPQSLGPVIYTLQGVRLENSFPMQQQQQQQESSNQMFTFAPNFEQHQPRPSSEGNLCQNHYLVSHHTSNNTQSLGLVQNQGGSGMVYGGSDGKLPLLQNRLQQLQGSQGQSIQILQGSFLGGGSGSSSRGDPISLNPNSSSLVYSLPQAAAQQAQHHPGDLLPMILQGGGNISLDIGQQQEMKLQQHLREAREKLAGQNQGGANGTSQFAMDENQHPRPFNSDPQLQQPPSQLAAFALGGPGPLPTSTKSQSNLGRSSEGTLAKFSRRSYHQGPSHIAEEPDEEEDGDLKAKFSPMSLSHLIKPDSNARLTTQEKNRNAQRRFRERQKERVSQLEADSYDLKNQLQELGKRNAELASLNSILEKSLNLINLMAPSDQEGQAASSDGRTSGQPQVQAQSASSITDLSTLVAYWRDSVKSLIRSLVKNEAGGVSVTPEAVQSSQALTDLTFKLGRARPELIRQLAATHLESTEVLIGACEVTQPAVHTPGTEKPPKRPLTPSQQHWRAVVGALGAGFSDEQKQSLVAAGERYQSRLHAIVEDRSALLSSCLFDPQEDPSLLLSIATAHLALSPPFKSAVKFQAAIENLKANLHREYLAYAELDGLVIKMVLTPEQVAHARCLSYPVPLDALGIVQAVTQIDGKKLLAKSTEARLAAVRDAVPKHVPSSRQQRRLTGDSMEGSEDVAGEGTGDGGEEDEEMEADDLDRSRSAL